MIGLFDSGMGGLSVLRAVRTRLPEHDLLFVADGAGWPYGPQPASYVQRRSLAISRRLYDLGARIIVVACNTATGAAIELLRSELPVPVVGMEPGVKPAAALTRSGRIGVLATGGTLSGQRFQLLVERFASNQLVLARPSPELVELTERGDLQSAHARELVSRAVNELLAEDVDVLVLGSTHFPPLAPLISEVAGPQIAIIDTGPAVAEQVARVAQQTGVGPGSARLRLFTTADPAGAAAAMARVWGAAVQLEHLPL